MCNNNFWPTLYFSIYIVRIIFRQFKGVEMENGLRKWREKRFFFLSRRNDHVEERKAPAVRAKPEFRLRVAFLES